MSGLQNVLIAGLAHNVEESPSCVDVGDQSFVYRIYAEWASLLCLWTDNSLLTGAKIDAGERICHLCIRDDAQRGDVQVFGLRVPAISPLRDYDVILRTFANVQIWRGVNVSYKDECPLRASEGAGRGLHFLQLSLHDVQLSPKNNASYNAYCEKRGGKYSDSSSPSRHYQVAIGFLLLSASAATVFVTFKATEYTDDYWPAARYCPNK
jgi:hypothetical protein